MRSTLWPEDHNERGILNIAFLTGEIPVRAIPPGEEGHVPEVWGRDWEEEKKKELPSPVIKGNEKVIASGPANDCGANNATNSTISRAPARASAEDPARSAYRERCMYWRRYTHALW